MCFALRKQSDADASEAGILMGDGCVRVGVSPLHGSGVFATSTIPPLTLLGEYVGKVMRVRPLDCTYVMCVTVDRNEHVWIDASDPADSNWTRYLNDPGDGAQASCEFGQNDLAVEVWSCRRITAGEELTVKYMTWKSPSLGQPDASTPRRSVRTTPRSRRPSRSASPQASVRQVRPARAPTPTPRPHRQSQPARKPRRRQAEEQEQEDDAVPIGELSTALQLRDALRGG